MYMPVVHIPLFTSQPGLIQLASQSYSTSLLVSLCVCHLVCQSVCSYSYHLSVYLAQTELQQSRKNSVIHTIYWQNAGKGLGLKLPFTFVVPGDWVFSLVLKSARAGTVLGMEKQLLTGNQMLRWISSGQIYKGSLHIDLQH